MHIKTLIKRISETSSVQEKMLRELETKLLNEYNELDGVDEIRVSGDEVEFILHGKKFDEDKLNHIKDTFYLDLDRYFYSYTGDDTFYASLYSFKYNPV